MKPIIIVVDELDRCRPDYALSLLEVVKHFFSVRGVRFVLGVNLDALEESVRQRYGSGVAARQYLQKFLHLKVGLPSFPAVQDWESYFDNICERLAVDDKLHDDARYILLQFVKRKISLRDVERIAARIALMPADFANWFQGYRLLVISACILETLDPASYTKLRSGKLALVDIQEAFGLDRGMKLGQHPSYFTFHFWAYLLTDAPEAETLEATKGIFGHGRTKPSIEATLVDVLDKLAPPK